MNQTIPTPASITFRPLKWNELVRRGDYVEDGNDGFEPWVGPAGFHAGSFIKKIYRKRSRSPATETPVEETPVE
jgi:hypothetical protein